MDESEKLLELLRESLDEFRKSNSLSAATLAKLDKAVDDNTKAQKDQTKQAKEAAKAMEDLKDSAVGLLKGLGSAAQGARDNREDFRSLKPAVSATGMALKGMTSSLGEGIGTLGAVVSGLGKMTRFLPGIGKLGSVLATGLGAGISAAGSAISKLPKEVVDAGTAFMNFALDETQRVVGAFQDISKIGGVTGDSFRGLQQAALQTGLGVDQFARVIGKNAKGLADAGGTVTQGMRAVVDITKASKGFEDQFLKLGIGFEEQRDLTAQFLGYQRSLQGVNLKDTKALSEASRAYILQLDELARLTGMSRQEAADRLMAQTRQVRFGAVLEDAAKRGPQFSGAISNAAEIISKIAPRLGAGFKDIFDNVSSPEAQEFFRATGGAGPALVNYLERTGDLAGFMEQLQVAVKNTYETMGGTKYERQQAVAGTVFRDTIAEMRQFKNATNLTSDIIRSANEEQKKAGENKNKETEDIITAQKSLRDFAVAMDSIVMQQFPKLTGAVKMLTGVMEAGAKSLDKILGTGITTSGGGATGGGGGGGGGGGSAGRGGGQPVAPVTGGEPGGGAARANIDRVLDLIGRVESRGNYNVLVGGKQADLTNMTLQQVYDMQKTMMRPGSGFASSAVGKYQFIYGTLRSMANKLGMDPETTKFTPEVQDQLARELVIQQGYNKYAAGAITKERFLQNLAGTWAGLPGDPSGRSRYHGFNTNKAGIGWEEAMGSFAYGGITSGPRSGYMAMLHGTEAVVPLPGGRSIPVEMTGMTDTMGKQLTMLGEQLGRFDTMINLLQNNVDISRKILTASR